ncbi:MAG: hypothetical protein Q8Q09_10030 [Deltaproteobacteria bacterium]|nr:hypothetical protein [Deltaproteobacteria bacterium]
MTSRCRSRAAPLAWATLAAALVGATPHRAHAQTNDPRLTFRTFETEHFRVHFHQGLREAAERVATVSEAAYRAVGARMGYLPAQITEVVLTDTSDDANGSATSIPFNAIRLFVTAPEDLSVLGEYDDWLELLVLHEYTHVTHADQIGGIPALINRIFGKIYPPNLVQPRWILEGIATYNESRMTSGGRLHSSIWDMYLRADALADTFVTLDQLSTGPNRWPHGNIYYLYGSNFVGHVLDRFGPQAFASVSRDYGAELIPYGINRSLQRATGHTWEELWPEFLQATRARYRAQREQVVARGLIEGQALTHQGEEVAYPRFVDNNTVVFQSSDGHSHPMFRSVDVRTLSQTPRELGWYGSSSGWALSPERTRIVRSDVGFYRGIYAFRDLYLSAIDRDDQGRIEHIPVGQLLTHGGRALYPDWSPDGDHIAYTVNHSGTQSLVEYTLSQRQERPLVRVRSFEQAFTPRYSPDGRSVVFSQWQRGGFRDIRLLHRESGAITEITHDRAADMQPCFSPDGRYIVYSSDRTGIHNLFAYELSTGLTRQITNVVHGAFMPAISQDGQWITYVGYTHRGYELYRLRWSPAQWLEPGPTPARRPHEEVDTPSIAMREVPYRPWPTLAPRTWIAEFGDDGFGPTVAVTSGASDVLGIHSWSAQTSLGFVSLQPSFSLSYVYRGLRPTMSLSVGRAVQRQGYTIAGRDFFVPRETYYGDLGMSVGFPSLFFSHALSFGYSARYAGPVGAVPGGGYVDPNELAPATPTRSTDASLRASWSFSSSQRYSYDISTHEGFQGALSMRASDRAIGSARGGFDVNAVLAGFVPIPLQWRRYQHVLAVRAAGGVGTTDRGEATFYSLGGFAMFDPLAFLTSLPSLAYGGSTPLRGYAPGARSGAAFLQANVEYRFPLLQVDRGISTLPVYFSRVWGAVFVDAGHAWFGRLQPTQMAVGMGAEVFADLVWGYLITTTLRFGVGQGVVGQDAQTQVYGMLGTPF